MNALEIAGAVFGALTGSAVLLGVLGWLARSLLQNLLAKDLEEFKAELTVKVAESTERLKAALQVASVEHQVRYTKLHEKRGEVIESVHHQLAELLWHTQAATSIIQFAGDSEPTPAQSLVAADTARAELYRYMQKHRIYLPVDTCKRIDALLNDFRSKMISFHTWSQVNEFAPQEVVLQRQDVIIETFSFFAEAILAPMDELEAAFRTLLDPSPST